jgi:hypothetical protein
MIGSNVERVRMFRKLHERFAGKKHKPPVNNSGSFSRVAKESEKTFVFAFLCFHLNGRE